MSGIIVKPGSSRMRRAVGATLSRGSTRSEKRRFAREQAAGIPLTEMDRTLELIASKRAQGGSRSPVCSTRIAMVAGAPTPVWAGPFPYLLSDDTILRLTEYCMERLFEGDRGRYGDALIPWESMVLTEAALALNVECECRGLVPMEDSAKLRASIEAQDPRGSIGIETRPGVVPEIGVTTYGPVPEGEGP